MLQLYGDCGYKLLRGDIATLKALKVICKAQSLPDI